MYGLITVGAIAATIAAINYANNKDLHDTTMITQAGAKLINDPVGLYNDISASLATSSNQFMNASNETLKNAMNYAQTTSFTDMVHDAQEAATSQLDYVKGLTSALFISFTATNAIVANNEHVQAAAPTPESTPVAPVVSTSPVSQQPKSPQQNIGSQDNTPTAFQNYMKNQTPQQSVSSQDLEDYYMTRDDNPFLAYGVNPNA
jgi:hypothetical protein